ncbi:MAG: hypothetical protein J5789_09265 [Oscillospiraceae bacterium]|nr:hypothetical protein [Oscillospiraceae bacterium]
MIRRLKARLRSKRGESIAEVLIALMISSMALVLLAGMITATTGIVKKSKDATNEYTGKSNQLVEKLDSECSGSGEVHFLLRNVSGALSDTKLTDSAEESISVLYYVNESIGSVKVTSYEKRTAP